MKKSILFLGLALLATTAMAGGPGPRKVMRKDGGLMNVPAFGTQEADMVARRHAPLRIIGDYRPAYFPHTGTPRVLTILVNFADSAFSVNQPKAAFNQFFNGEEQKDLGNGNQNNIGSVAQYFNAMSNGAFTPVFDVYGPVTVERNMAYYGGNNPYSNADEKTQQLLKDAIKLVEDSVDNVADYDSNNDGNIDCVFLVYAGPGQNFGGGPSTVWAVTSISASAATFKGKNVGLCTMTAELAPYKVSDENDNWMISGIGVACHEFSHAMGLPDLYPYNANARVDNQEMEYWDLMDGGEYVRNGFAPTAYTAWEKAQMGWDVDIRTLEQNGSYTMSTTTEQGGTAYKMNNPANKNGNEYMMLENVQRSGWNRYVPGHGLLVYHVYDQGTIYMTTKLNDTKDKPGMAVVPADSACLSSYLAQNQNSYMQSHYGDPFPGTSRLTRLNDDLGLPNFYWYDGDNEASATNEHFHRVNQALDNIVENDGTIVFDYIANAATGIRDTRADATTRNRTTAVYTIDGRLAGHSLRGLPKGVYIVNGQKWVVR